MHNSTDPIELLDDELSKFIEQCLSNGEQLVVGIDANENVRDGTFTQRMREIGLVEICTHKHGMEGPPTYARGTTPIDAIYVSQTLLGLACGYLPITGDHRILWLDIDIDAALGRPIPASASRPAQQLTLQDPRVVHKYVTTLTRILEREKFLPRLQSLRLKLEQEVTDKTLSEYNKLDTIRLKGILLADKQCRHFKMGQVPFSPQLVMAWNKLRAWQVLVKKLNGGRVSSRYLQRVVKAAAISNVKLISVSEAEENLANCWINYKSLKKEAVNLRTSWIEGLVSARAAQGNLSLAQEMKNLLTREQQRRDSRIIRFSMASKSRKSLSAIAVLDKNNEWQEITKQHPMEEALLQELKARFNQAANTPFQTPPLLDALGPLGVSDGAKQILRGHFATPRDSDEWSNRLIPFLAQVIPMDKPTDLSPEQHKLGWKRVKEKTAAGPSGITIPHMKANGTSPYLTEIDCIMANLPYRFGFSPKQWRQALDVMIEKKPGVRQLSTLRAILLFEADFNQNNKRLGREMPFRAESANAVAIEQYGSRKHMSVTDQSLNKALTFDLWRQLRQRGALCSNDAKACYDRIVHNCASLCLQRIGTREQPIVSMFETLQKLEHHVRTVFGESKICYVQRGKVPIQGVGQGNGAGPQIWALVSTPVLNMLRETGLGATFLSALSQISTTLVGFAFVDDTDLITSGPRMPLKEVVSRIQESLNAWEGGIKKKTTNLLIYVLSLHPTWMVDPDAALLREQL
jgi:hypothetical protein